jgi:serine/threonine protein kinase
MVTEEEDSLKITLIDFNVSKRFREENTGNKLLMMTNTGAAAFCAPEIHSSMTYK